MVEAPIDQPGAIPTGVEGHLLPDADERPLRFLAYVGSPTGPTWRRASTLFETDIDGLLAATRERTASISDAVAGSLVFEEYSQRLLPPLLALAYEHRMGVTAVESVLVDYRAGRFQVTCHPDAVVDLQPASLEAVTAGALGPHLDHVAGVVHRCARTPRRVLRGAVAHVITTAFLHLSWPRPNPAHYLPAARTLLERMGLGDLVHLEGVPAAGEVWMYAERRSCCLAFRSGALGRTARYCATCPVTPEADRRSVFDQAAGSYRRRTGTGGP